MQKKKCLKLIKEISQYKELECLVIENAEGGLLSYSGDVVGEENKIKFEKIAKKHGYIALGTNVSVWSSV